MKETFTLASGGINCTAEIFAHKVRNGDVRINLLSFHCLADKR